MKHYDMVITFNMKWFKDTFVDRDNVYFYSDTSAEAWYWIHNDVLEEVAFVGHVDISNDWDRYIRKGHMRKPTVKSLI